MSISCAVFFQGKLDHKARASALAVLGMDRTAVLFHDLARDKQAKAETAEIFRLAAALEAPEDAVQRVRRDADAAVLDEHQRVRVRLAEADVDGTAGAVLDRIADEIGQHLFEAEPVPMAEHAIFEI